MHIPILKTDCIISIAEPAGTIDFFEPIDNWKVFYLGGNVVESSPNLINGGLILRKTKIFRNFSQVYIFYLFQSTTQLFSIKLHYLNKTTSF